MSHTIDAVVFVWCLIINIVAGLLSSRNIKTIKEYAIGIETLLQ